MAKIVAFIPARAGSKSIPNKNIKSFGGKPLIHWVVNAALDCKYIDKVYVSTDGKEIQKTVNEISNPKLKVVDRPKNTAEDSSTTESAMIDFANKFDFKDIVLIQATSPFLKSKDLDGGITKYLNNNFDSLISIVRQKRFIWLKNNELIKPYNYFPIKRPRRQDFKGFFVENGAFYITSKKLLLRSNCRISGKTSYYEMSENSYCEIDEENDWKIGENLIDKNNFKIKNNIKLFCTDVDGVLTDSGMYYSEKGDELKKFNTRDGRAIELLKKHKIKTAIITSENTSIVKKRGDKIGVDFIFQGINNKLEHVKKLCREQKIKLSEIAFIGDDLNDLNLLKKVGLSACPSNAVYKIKNISDYICSKKGGDGCMREFAEKIIEN